MRCSEVLVFIASIYVVMEVGASNSNNNPPCNVNDADPPAVNVPFESHLPGIKEQLLNLKPAVEVRLQEMRIDYGVDGDTYSFMNFFPNISYQNSSTFLHDFRYDQPSFLYTIRGNYDQLNQCAYYLQLLTQTAYDNTARESLLLIQTRIYDVMCAMKMLLRSANLDPGADVPSGTLSSSFVQYRMYNTRAKQHTAEYVTAKYVKKVARILKSGYTAVVDHF